jgi:predicted Zn-dependent peptidase
MPPAFVQHRLSNGLTILAEVDAEAHTAAIGFFVKTGARDEAPAVMGVSHFLEHMMFKGTAARSAADVDRDFDDIGADHNAFTTSEMTAFHAHVLPEHLPRAQEVLCDIMRPALRSEDFDAEKSVILEEIAMYEDHPFWVLYERAMEAFYGRHPLSHRVLGTRESITALTPGQMQGYFQQRYSADNVIVALAGRLDFSDMCERIASHCRSWQATRSARQYPPVQPASAAFTLESARVNREYLLLLAPGPSLQDERRYAAAVLAQVLGDSEGSRLYWALIESGLAEEAQAQHEGRDGTGELLVYLSCSPEDAARVEAMAHDEIDRLLPSLTQDDLDRVKSKIATAATLHGERPSGRMKRLGQIWTYTGGYRSLDDDLRRIQAVTLEEVREVGRAFPFSPRVTARLRPAGS